MALMYPKSYVECTYTIYSVFDGQINDENWNESWL